MSRPSDLPELGLGYPGTELRRRLVAAVLSGAKTATAGLAEEERVDRGRRPLRRRGRNRSAEGDRRGHGGPRRPSLRDRPRVRARRGRRLRVGRGLARGARAVLRAADRARDHDRGASVPRRGAALKVWIDMTAPAHVLVFRPLIEILRGAAPRSRSRRGATRRPSSSSSCTGSRRRSSGSTAAARGWRRPGRWPAGSAPCTNGRSRADSTWP